MKAANRGKQWQGILSAEFAAFGDHTIVKTDPPVRVIKILENGRFEGVFSAAGQCDYEGGFRGRAVCLEAKDCHEPVFLKDRIRTGQWDRLYDTWIQGGISGLLLRFAGATADRDEMWLVEFGAVRYLFQKKARFAPDQVTAENAHRLAYRAISKGAIGVYGLESALIRIDARLSQESLPAAPRRGTL